MDGGTLTFSSAPLTSIANGSLQNKICPPRKEIFKSLQKKAFDTWHRKKLVPSIPLQHITALWQSSWSLHTHPRGHHPLQTTLPGLGVPQRGQTCYVPTDLLPMFISSASKPPSQTLRSFNASTPPRSSDPHHHREADHPLQKAVSVVSWSWQGTTQCICPAKTEETIPLRPPYRQLLFCPVQTYAQLRGQALVPTDPSCFSTQPARGDVFDLLQLLKTAI